MSEREKEIAEEEEVETLNNWIHDHPLTLVETVKGGDCYGCGRRCASGDRAYACSTKSWRRCEELLLHEECAEMARKVRHPLHPQHVLIHQKPGESVPCAICNGYKWRSLYICTSLGCKFEMHVSCAQGSGTMVAASDDEEEGRISRTLLHPSHPKHELTLLGRRSSFKCDACGTKRGGKSYICSACEYWIHEGCATLHETMEREDHHHPLSLSFHVPPRYMKFNYRCEVCNKFLLPRYWIYHCQLCGYVVHLKCAFVITKKDEIPSDEKGIIRLPVNDVAGDQIMPFVMRERGAIPTIPHDGDDKYNFIHHKHQLTLISSSHHHHHQNVDEEEDDDYHDYEERSELTCDGCITPIFSPSPSSSSSSSSEKYYYYMSCDECKYYLHWACFNLPPHLPSLPLHPYPDHELVLQSCPKLSFTWYCSVCYLRSNGLFYSCKKCYFKADVKCASLLPTIRHAAHPQHPLTYVGIEDLISFPRLQCAADCKFSSLHEPSYACRGCEFLLHVSCALLPPSVRSDRWDRQHLLPLTHNANINHPGDFYCDECETEMNPKSWMYHCRSCDLSFHPECFINTSGYSRNIKFGGKYVNNAAHPHTLAYQLLTTKRHCDVCRRDMYKHTGFHCPSCNFFVCYFVCNEEMFKKGHIEAID